MVDMSPRRNPRRAPSPLILLALLVLLPWAPGAWGESPDTPAQPGVPDAELQKAIDRAIKTGADWLRAQQKFSGLIGGVTTHGALHYEVGSTALSGLALLHAGDKRGDDPANPNAVDKVLEFCRHKDLQPAGSAGRTTYGVGVLLMFLTDYYRPEEAEDEWQTLSAPEDLVEYYDPTDIFGDLADALAEAYPSVAPEVEESDDQEGEADGDEDDEDDDEDDEADDEDEDDEADEDEDREDDEDEDGEDTDRGASGRT